MDTKQGAGFWIEVEHRVDDGTGAAGPGADHMGDGGGRLIKKRLDGWLHGDARTTGFDYIADPILPGSAAAQPGRHTDCADIALWPHANTARRRAGSGALAVDAYTLHV